MAADNDTTAVPFAATARPAPLLAGLLLGVGLGGMLDGIVLHEVLQLHSMLSARVPPDTLAAVHVNMRADGLFHAAMWLITVTGLVLLVKGLRRSAGRCSGRALCGAALAGWGGFNTVEGLVDHHLLGLHNVVQAADAHWPADLAFLASGLLLMALGAALYRRSTSQNAPA